MTTLRLAPLDTTTQNAFEAFQHEVWQPTWDADLEKQIMHWRFCERPLGDTWLAFDNERCIAALDSVLRPYLYNGQRIVVRETANWFCLEPYRPSGIGISLLRKMMQGSEPILVVGATETTQKILPRLRWQAAVPARHYVFAVKLRGFVAAALRAKRPSHEAFARIIPHIRLPRPHRILPPQPYLGGVQELADNASCPVIPIMRDGLVQVIENVQWQWLASMPQRLGQIIGLVFRLNGREVGFTVSQIEPAESGVAARILHTQIIDSDQSWMNWMMSETTQFLIEFGVEFIRCRTCVGPISTALDTIGFRLRHVLPSFWWSRHMPPPISLEVGYLRGDEAIPFRRI